ncbi:unnamed protein product, partial [Tetraodon nigroviridis]
RLRERLQVWLSQYEPLLLLGQRLLVWERPLYSISVALTLHTLFWLLSSTSLRPLFLLSVSLLGLMLLERWKPSLPIITSKPRVIVVFREGETVSAQQRLLSVPELSHHLAESYLTCCLFLQEMLQYKRQNHGKFCAAMCSGCFVLAVVGHYVPGIMISYIVVLSVLLWPLVVYHELIQRMYTGLEPILMKLDYSMKGETEHRKHDKRKVKKESEEGGEPRAETESESEEELSCFAPTVDVKTTALAMAITDSELSDEEASILESGGFSVSRATTPQLTDLSEVSSQEAVRCAWLCSVNLGLFDDFPLIFPLSSLRSRPAELTQRAGGVLLAGSPRISLRGGLSIHRPQSAPLPVPKLQPGHRRPGWSSVRRGALEPRQPAYPAPSVSPPLCKYALQRTRTAAEREEGPLAAEAGPLEPKRGARSWPRVHSDPWRP